MSTKTDNAQPKVKNQFSLAAMDYQGRLPILCPETDGKQHPLEEAGVALVLSNFNSGPFLGLSI